MKSSRNKCREQQQSKWAPGLRDFPFFCGSDRRKQRLPRQTNPPSAAGATTKLPTNQPATQDAHLYYSTLNSPKPTIKNTSSLPRSTVTPTYQWQPRDNVATPPREVAAHGSQLCPLNQQDEKKEGSAREYHLPQSKSKDRDNMIARNGERIIHDNEVDRRENNHPTNHKRTETATRWSLPNIQPDQMTT